jgi:sulfur carrier protein
MHNMTTPALQVSLNGKRMDTLATTLQDLLLDQGYALQGAFACAINSTFVPRAQWPERRLQADDRIDVITPIAGG